LKIIISILMALILTVNLNGANLKGLSYAGIRLGVGHISQDSPDEQYSDYAITADQNGFYSEAFYNWHFSNDFALEITLAAFNRGEFRWQIEGIGNLFGSINIYPLMVGLKVKPFASMLEEKYQPYVNFGGSLVVGRNLIEGGTVVDPTVYLEGDSFTTWGWYAGAGFESFISSTICITSSIKYQKLKFDEAVGGYLDHSGYQISFGAAYIIRKIN
jgi:hypothetical protein